MKAISYSLFGYDKARHKDCFDFESYLRGLMISLRMNRLIYPGWTNIVHVDKATHEGFKDLFDAIPAEIRVEEDAPLCLAMLWRLKPIFEKNADQSPKYSHVICRDLDSPSTYRERLCVEQWIQHDKTAHAITDSVSHSIPMMGGMIGFRPEYFIQRVAPSWERLITGSFSFDRKGSDQDFLNRVVYPKVAQPGSDAITQHYLLGYGNTFLMDWHNEVPELELDIDEELRESDHVCGHIGAAGWYETAMFKFLRQYWGEFEDLLKIEKNHPKIFYWS